MSNQLLSIRSAVTCAWQNGRITLAGIYALSLFFFGAFIAELHEVAELTESGVGVVFSSYGDDREVRFASNTKRTQVFISNDPFSDVGDIVPVRYNPRRLQDARINDIYELYAPASLLLLFGCGFLCLAGIATPGSTIQKYIYRRNGRR